MTVEASLRPRGPYSFALTVRAASDATRVVRDGTLEAVVQGGDGPEHVRAWQTPDGTVHILARSEEGVERMRFVLALDDGSHGVSPPLQAARIGRDRGLTPWSVGIVCLEGLGRRERGLVGDLALVKLASGLRGRCVEASETAELLEPYGEWAGLASVYLMAGFSRGLIPLPDGSRIRKPPARIHRRAA